MRLSAALSRWELVYNLQRISSQTSWRLPRSDRQLPPHAIATRISRWHAQ